MSMIFLFNFSITLICIWLLNYIYCKVFVPTKLNMIRNELFSIRDRLAMLAMHNAVKVNEEQEEYIFFATLLNKTIAPLNEFKLTVFINVMVDYFGDLKNGHDKTEIDKIIESDLPEEFKNLFLEYINVVTKIMNKQITKFEFAFLFILILILNNKTAAKIKTKQ
jgi:hypothetical protein